MNCYSLPSDTESDLLRHLVLAFGNWRCHIHGRPTARCKRGDGVWHSAEPFCHQLAPPPTFTAPPAGALCWRQTGLVPPVAASQQKLAFGAGAQGALAKVSVISRLESRSTSRGSCLWEDETEECGPRARLGRGGGLMLEAGWQCHQWRHLVAGRVSHDVALQRSAPSQHPPLQGHCTGVPAAPVGQPPT